MKMASLRNGLALLKWNSDMLCLSSFDLTVVIIRRCRPFSLCFISYFALFRSPLADPQGLGGQ
jgi:hypothetical protein